ncbi:DUF6273 domain-containing protein [Clostridium sp. AWRP]|uniref:DUF6273 domain-containing protein n=1 Tax=Clostridium sp. AWRP TaxID=2212991 RepID=UPI000FD8B020|nr:DUF6273 domain-containing protein [Clostridium sp. AWRP]AZV56081.1 hypothetical protein DMR38_05415 [Clostridium sp. AWRP]
MSQAISNLEVGNKIKLGKYQVESETEEPITWIVADKNHTGYPANSVTLVAENIIDLRGVDGAEAGNSNSMRASHGSNRYRTSNLRQWLNSSGAASGWFTAQNLTDGTTDTNNHDASPIDANFCNGNDEACPTGYDTKKGFLNSFSANELSSILNTDLTVVKSSATDGGGSEVVTDKVFLLSNTEVGLADEGGIAEGSELALFSALSAYKTAPLTQAAISNTKATGIPSPMTGSWEWWLRTPKTDPFIVNFIAPDGSLSANYANTGSIGVRPSLNINDTTLVSDDVDSDGAYTLEIPTGTPQTVTIYTKRIVEVSSGTSNKISNLSVGDKIKLGKYQVESETEEPIVWVVADKNHTGYPANSVTLVAEKVIDLRGFDGKEAGNQYGGRSNYGSNRYRTSNLRQWLNSSGAASEWFTPQNLEDGTTDGTTYANGYDASPIDDNFSKDSKACPTGYDTKKGFLNSFSSNELKSILDTDLKVVKNMATDGGSSEVVTDKVFLLSNTEVGLANENSIAEGNILALFNTESNRPSGLTQAAILNTKSIDKPNIEDPNVEPWDWWLRTPDYSTPYLCREVHYDGSLAENYANTGSFGVRPALNISDAALVSNTKDSDGAYTLAVPSGIDTKRIVTVPGIPQSVTTDTKREIANSLKVSTDSKREITNSEGTKADTKRILKSIQTIAADIKRKVIELNTSTFDTLRRSENSISISIDTERKVRPAQTINIDTKRKIKEIQITRVDTKRINQFIQNFRIDTKRISLFVNFQNKAVKKYDIQMDLMYAVTNDLIKVTQNDFGAVVFNITIASNGESVNLVGNSINIIIDNKNNVGVCTIVDAVNGVVQYKLTQKDTATLGVHQFALELITADSRVTTEKAKYTVIEDLNS